MSDRTQKRSTTLVSGQPFFWKWWWIGAIRKNRRPSPGPAAGDLEVADLDDDREGLPDEDPADDDQGERLLDHEGDQAQRPPIARDPVSPMKTSAG